MHTTNIADGEQIESEELTLLGDILSRTNVDFTTSYGVDIQQLDQSLTYEEMQFVLSEDPATEFLSQNLKDKLESSELNLFCCFIAMHSSMAIYIHYHNACLHVFLQAPLHACTSVRNRYSYLV